MLKEEIQSPELIERTNELINELHEYSSDELEIMASLYYLYRQSPSSTYDDLICQLRDLKPHISPQQMQDALRIFEIMDRYQTS
jgi:hypothetical protein